MRLAVSPVSLRRSMRRPIAPFSPARLRLSLALLGFAALTGCSSTQPSPRLAAGTSDIDPRYGVRASPRVVADGEEVPKGGGNYMVGKPYQIAGKTYVPTEKPFAATGTASWYGADFHGRRTANGEIFDRNSITAAHPTMPLPSYARVTNLRNEHSMIVRVNDRGPYHGGRVMDVSQRVAEALDFRSAGTARVKVEWIGRARLAGDNDARLLATLRQDGQPATLEGFASSIMKAAREEPIHTASIERPRARDAELTALASDAEAIDADEAPAARPRAAAAFKSAPLPPVRPYSLDANETRRPRLRQAAN